MGRWHARELQRAGGELVGVADSDREAARRLAPDLGEQSLDALLELQPDVVHVCTPLDTHAALVERILAAGAHVLCEKPLARDAPETERLLALAADRELLLCPVHQYLFQPGFARAVAAMPRLGPLLHAEVTACSAGGKGRRPADLDDVVAEIVPHSLAALDRLLPGGVGALAWDVRRPRHGELRATTTAGESTVSLLTSLAGRPTANTLRLTGAGGTAHLDFFHGFAAIESGGVSRSRKLAHPFALSGATAAGAAVNLVRRAARGEPAYPGLRALVARLYAAVRDGGAAPISPEETLAVARARDALRLG